jgi:DDE superfamily endonuclease
VHDGHTMEPPDALRTFRRSFYECIHRRADALFELADAILTADGAAPSPAHLSLQASHRRGWGSLYAALDRGRIDGEALRKLLASHPLASAVGEPPIFAVDASVWDRCDAETSPQRGYYYHPWRHSAGQPIVAGSGLTSSSRSWASPARAGPPPWT